MAHALTGKPTAQDFYAMVRRMRAAQKRYFKNRERADLEMSRQLEREVDRATDEYFNPVLM